MGDDVIELVRSLAGKDCCGRQCLIDDGGVGFG